MQFLGFHPLRYGEHSREWEGSDKEEEVKRGMLVGKGTQIFSKSLLSTLVSISNQK